jgi:hypothetical protein
LPLQFLLPAFGLVTLKIGLRLLCLLPTYLQSLKILRLRRPKRQRLHLLLLLLALPLLRRLLHRRLRILQHRESFPVG